MTRERVSDAQLGAYVDGELDLDDAARVARAIAADRALAERVAVLSRLKASVARGQRAPQPLPAPRRRPLRAVAAALLLLVSAAAFVTWHPARAPDPLAPLIASARSAHLAWIGAGIGDAAAPERVESSLRRVGAGAGSAPDLSAAGLVFSHVRSVAAGRALHVGYAGTRGCMVSLLIVADGAAFPASLETRRVAGRDLYLWRSHGGGYLLLGDRMSAQRLATVARTVHAAVRRRGPLDADDAKVLIASRRQSPPCATA